MISVLTGHDRKTMRNYLVGGAVLAHALSAAARVAASAPVKVANLPKEYLHPLRRAAQQLAAATL